jgi:hypothetical protein
MRALLPRKGRWSLADVIARLWQADQGADSWPMRSRKSRVLRVPAADDPVAFVEDLRAASELRVLISHGPDEAYLLPHRMAALGIDPDELARLEPVVFQNLHSRCTACESQGRCAWDLADDLNPSWKEPPDGWQGYCPNVAELSAILEMPWFRSDVALP